MSPLARLHRGLVFGRRARVLSERIAALLPSGASVLDVGCGDGTIARLIAARRPDLSLTGIDTLARPSTCIPVALYDGGHLPYPDGSFDVAMLVDVLHHAEDPEALLREARRVGRRAVIVKDHTCHGLLAGPTLRLMDWVGNAPHGVPVPGSYWPEARWRGAFARAGLRPTEWHGRLDLYPPPARWIFDRSLHFLARLEPA